MVVPTESLVDVRGTRARLWRGGDGPPLLFLHGAAGATWSEFHYSLAADFEVFLTEHPGFGRSPAQPGVETMKDLAVYYRDALASLGLKNLHLMGNSLGGWLASELALLYPIQVETLTLLAPIGMHPRPPHTDGGRTSREQAVRSLYFDQSLADRALERALSADDVATQQRNREAAQHYTTPAHNPELGQELAALRPTSFLVWGENDQIAPVTNADEWSARLRAETLVLPHCGHLPHIECPELVTTWIRSQLQRVEGERRLAKPWSEGT